MAEPTMDEFLKDNHDAILVAVQARMRGDETMGRVAAQRELSESELSAQVLSFMLDVIRSDLMLGSAAAMRQGLPWLASLREGHDLAFDAPYVSGVLDQLGDEIEARLGSAELREEYAAYREQVAELVDAAFTR